MILKFISQDMGDEVGGMMQCLRCSMRERWTKGRGRGEKILIWAEVAPEHGSNNSRSNHAWGIVHDCGVLCV